LQLSLATLFGFQHEAGVPVKIDKARAGRAVCILKMHGSLEDILVTVWLAGRRLRSFDPEHIA
jgi:hypothetical protein